MAKAFLNTASIFIGVGLFICFFSGLAFAEDNTNGFKMGKARLHPSLGLSLKYNSYAAQLTRDRSVGDLIFKVSPGADLDLKGTNLDFGLRAQVAYSRYLGVASERTPDASFVGVQAETDLTARLANTLSITVSDKLKRSDESPSPTIQIGVISLNNDAGIRLNWRPWNGTLRIEPSYHLKNEAFSKQSTFDNLLCDPGFTCTTDALESSNYLDHRVNLITSWGFLPKSALTLQLGYNARRYTGNNGVNADALDAAIGILTMIMPKLHLSLGFGWSHEFGDVFSTPTAKVSVTYSLTTQSKLSLSYIRSVSPTPGLTWTAYTSDRVHLGSNLIFIGKILVNANVGANFLSYKSKNNGTNNMTEVNFGVKGTYNILSWLDTGLAYNLLYNDKLMGNVDFFRHEVGLFINVHY